MVSRHKSRTCSWLLTKALTDCDQCLPATGQHSSMLTLSTDICISAFDLCDSAKDCYTEKAHVPYYKGDPVSSILWKPMPGDTTLKTWRIVCPCYLCSTARATYEIHLVRISRCQWLVFVIRTCVYFHVAIWLPSFLQHTLWGYCWRGVFSYTRNASTRLISLDGARNAWTKLPFWFFPLLQQIMCF